MANGSYIRSDDNKIKYTYILTITTIEMDKLKTYSPIYCIK